MDFGAFNIIKEGHPIHTMPTMAWNCGMDHKGNALWVTKKGIPIEWNHAGRELTTCGWLYPKPDENMENSPCGVFFDYGVSDAGFLYPENFRVMQFDGEFRNYEAQRFPISATTIINHEYFYLENAHGGTSPSQWINPTTLIHYDPYEGWETHDAIRFFLMFKPYCERLGVIQNVWFDENMVAHKTPNTDFVWLAPRKESNRNNKETLLNNSNRRPWCSSDFGVPIHQVGTFNMNETVNGVHPFIPKHWGDWTKTPKRNWRSGGIMFPSKHPHNQPNYDHIWNEDAYDNFQGDKRFLYELCNGNAVYWDIVNDGEPDEWDFSQWQKSLTKASYEGMFGANWDSIWENNDFAPKWQNAADFFLDIPKFTVVDVRIEVLTYQWSLDQEEHYFDNGSWHFSTYRLSFGNYFNSRLWTTFRQVAPCPSKESLGSP